MEYKMPKGLLAEPLSIRIRDLSINGSVANRINDVNRRVWIKEIT